MNHSPKATALVKEFEGFSPSSYKDQNGVWTIGFGHTNRVSEGQVCTEKQAIAWLDEDMGIADEAINRLVKVSINQNQYDALCSFIFNIGGGNFVHSTCLRTLNAGLFPSAAAAILLWDKIGGKVSAGLQRRRMEEKKLFETPVREVAQ